jgi:hypothetical protein
MSVAHRINAGFVATLALLATAVQAQDSSSAAPQPTGNNDGNDNNDNNNGGGGGGGGPTNSPILFFVALGFGVVFTNLW